MKYFRMTSVFILALIAQWWWSMYLSFNGLTPQILLILTVVAASRQGPVAAMCFGFFWGLFLDVSQVHIFGGNALLFTIMGYIVGSARRQIDVTGLAPQCVIVFVMTMAYFIGRGLLGLVFEGNFIWVGWAPFFIDPLYNCLLIPFLFIFWDRFVEL